MFNRKPNQSDTDNNDISDSNESSDDFAPQNQVTQESQEPVSEKIEDHQPARGSNEPSKPSVISEGFEFTGDITFQGTLNVDGSVNGSITVQNLLIGASGKINGSIKATTIQVRGSFIGDATCQDLTLGSQASVNAKINYSSLTIQRGANIQGELTKS
jgi:cytoskeletal protein CcmA (bactofilin family)